MTARKNTMRRRDFLKTIEKAAMGVAGASYLLASDHNSTAESAPYRFKMGVYLSELGLPFDESLAAAKKMGAEYVWINQMLDGPDVTHMTDAEADRMGERVSQHGLKIFLLSAKTFKKIHLTDLNVKTMDEHPAFRKEFNDLIRTMQIAARLGVKTVGTCTFAWPGEYTAGRPTWPMRWLTHGGVIADIDMDKLVNAFSMVLEQAERYDVDVSFLTLPWNYTNCTVNFRRIAERLGSRRIKVMWGPADCLNSGELDIATAGFRNVRPFLHGLHLKDLHVEDGLNLKFRYCPLGKGDVDYLTILRNLRDSRSDAVLSVSTHFLPPSGSHEEAMRINYANLKNLIRQVEAQT